MGYGVKQTAIGLAAVAVFSVPGAVCGLIAAALGAGDAAWIIFVAPYLAVFTIFVGYAVGGAVAYWVRWKWGWDV